MKRTAVCLLALLFWGGAWGDLVVTAGQNELRLFQSPCVHGGVLGMLKPEHRARFKKAQATVSGKLFFACWVDTGEGVYWVLYEDGDGAAYPIQAFTDQPGV